MSLERDADRPETPHPGTPKGGTPLVPLPPATVLKCEETIPKRVKGNIEAGEPMPKYDSENPKNPRPGPPKD